MKLYTRTGDDGSTGLYGGNRTTKDALRVEAYGTVDEFNSHLGLARTACETEGLDELVEIIDTLQPRLFDLGADLCTPIDVDPAKAPKQVRITEKHIEEMEALIDAVSAKLPPMKSFIMPGGCESAARLHLARCVCRRSERLVVALSRAEPVSEGVIPYLNRLADLLFAMARRANHLHNRPDVPCTPDV